MSAANPLWPAFRWLRLALSIEYSVPAKKVSGADLSVGGPLDLDAFAVRAKYLFM